MKARAMTAGATRLRIRSPDELSRMSNEHSASAYAGAWTAPTRYGGAESARAREMEVQGGLFCLRNRPLLPQK